MTIINRISTTCLLSLSLGALHPVAAQSLHTWVSSSGSDYGQGAVSKGAASSLCTLAAPCATLQAAIDVTAANGTVTVVDPGNYGGGGTTIQQSITIDAQPNSAGVSGTNITIAAGPGSTVILRGLNLYGDGSGNREVANGAILVSSVGLLDIEDSRITGFGVGILEAAATQLRIRNTAIENVGTGIELHSTNAVLDHSHIQASVQGVWFINSNGAITNSDVSFAATGVLVNAGSVVSIASSTISFCQFDIQGSSVLLNNSTLTGNTAAIGGGNIISLGTNLILDANAAPLPHSLK